MLHILLLEDNDADAELIVRRLEKSGLDCTVRRVQTRQAFEDALPDPSLGLILADYSVPTFEGLEALHMVRSTRPEVPFVFVSGALGEERAIETLKLGATDYVLKQRLERLVPAVERALGEARERVRARRAEAEQQRLSITERLARAETGQVVRRMEETLALLDGVFEAAPIGLAFLDVDGHCARVNAPFAALGGGTPASHVGRQLAETTPQLAPDLIGLHGRVVKTGTPVLDVEISGTLSAAPDDRRTWLAGGFPVHRSDGSLLGVGALVIDVTDRKRAEEKLRRQALRLQTFHDSDQAVLRARSIDDVARIIVVATSQLVQTDALAVTAIDLQREQACLIGARAGTTFLGRGAPVALEECGGLASLEGAPAVVDVKSVPDTCPVRLAMRAAGVRWLFRIPLRADGELVGALDLGSRQPPAYPPEDLDVAREIADQLAVALRQAALRERVQRRRDELEALVEHRTQALQEANHELEAFTYTVSHDLRAPLRAMEGFSQALLEDHGDRLDDEGREYAARIVGAAAQLDTLIRDLLAYSRVGRSDLVLEPVLLEDVARRALSHVPEALRNGAEVSVETAGRAVLGHRVTLLQAVTNLLENAFKFVPAGRPASVTLRSEDRDRLIRVWVEDRGIGIPMEQRENIFRVFERLHGIETYPGTGIGLAIVKKAAERMGGRVGVEENPGGGSRFWIDLPRADG